MPARKPSTARRRSKWTALQSQPETTPQELTGLRRAYPGLQHHDPEAAARAALLVEQGYGALEPWLSAEPEPMTLEQLLNSNISGLEAYEIWQHQQRQEQAHPPTKRGRRRAVDRIDWGDVQAVQVALFDAA
jgi:hypothetical protein